MSTTVLVTGGTGILGKYLVRKLLAAGRQVIVVCRTPDPSIYADTPSLQWVRGDVSHPLLGLDTNTCQKLAEKTGQIFHLAARTDFKGTSLAEYKPTNIDGVQNIYRFAMAAKAPLHHISTAFVCGKYKGIFAESMLDQGQQFRNFYEQSKFLGESFLRQQQQQLTIPKITIYRPGIILERNPDSDSGGNFGPFTFLDALFRLLLAEQRNKLTPAIIRVRGNRQQSMPFVFDDMVADAIFTLAELPDSHNTTYHLTSSSTFANEEIELLFNQAFGRKVVRWATGEEIRRQPLRPAEELLSRRTRVYADYLDLDLTFSRHNLNKALGKNTLPGLTTEEVLAAFSRFLSCKTNRTNTSRKSTTRQLQPPASEGISDYFNGFLPGFLDQPLLKNLSSLNTLFWLKILNVGTWHIRIVTGCLRAVAPGKAGDFGYTVTPETFLQVVCAERSPQDGFFRGQININGNTREGLRTATALEEFFSRYPYQKGHV